MPDNKMKCDGCGKEFPPEELDSKPSAPDWEKMTFEQRSALDWDRHECRDCYGPGYSEM